MRRMEVFGVEGEPTRFHVSSESREGEFHTVSFHRTTDPDYIEEHCSCEDFTMGIPHMISKGLIRDTIRNRRCKHIKRVLEVLTHETKKALIRADISQTEDSMREPSFRRGVRRSG